jgi:hypothetical protein
MLLIVSISIGEARHARAAGQDELTDDEGIDWDGLGLAWLVQGEASIWSR